jgi:hypothetical protein
LRETQLHIEGPWLLVQIGFGDTTSPLEQSQSIATLQSSVRQRIGLRAKQTTQDFTSIPVTMAAFPFSLKHKTQSLMRENPSAQIGILVQQCLESGQLVQLRYAANAEIDHRWPANPVMVGSTSKDNPHSSQEVLL